MAPFSLMSAGVSLLAKSFGLFSSVSSLARCTSAVPAIKSFSTTPAPPKRPLNSYMRFVKEQHPVVTNHYPGIKAVEIFRKIAQQWNTLPAEKKRPFQEASVVAREQFKVDLQRYKAHLTPGQTLLQAEERRERLAKRNSIRKKRELNNLGKPKRTRSAFNIYMSDHYEEAKGATLPMKMKTLRQQWTNLLGYQKQVYMQLSEDDKVRYNTEIKAWEDHMVEIGRGDLVRSKKKKTAVRKKTASKAAIMKKKKPAIKAKTAKASSTGASAGARKPSAANTVKKMK